MHHRSVQRYRKAIEEKQTCLPRRGYRETVREVTRARQTSVLSRDALINCKSMVIGRAASSSSRSISRIVVSIVSFTLRRSLLRVTFGDRERANRTKVRVARFLPRLAESRDLDRRSRRILKIRHAHVVDVSTHYVPRAGFARGSRSWMMSSGARVDRGV